MIYPRISIALCVWPVLTAATLLGAPSKTDLERVKPVPADQPIPLSDFYRPALAQAPVMNLAGSHVAGAVQTSPDQYSLFVEDLTAKKIEVAPSPRDRDVHNVWWMGDDHVLYTLAARKGGDIAIVATAVGKVNRPYPIIQNWGKIVINVPTATPLQPMVWMQGGNETGHDEGVSVVDATLNSKPLIDLLALNVSGTDFSDVKDDNIRHSMQNYPVPPGGITERYLCDTDDKLAFAITSKEGVEALYRLSGRTWEKCPVNLDEIEVIDAGNQPGELVVLGPREADKPRALQFMDAATGKLGDVVLQDTEYDFNGTLYRDRVSHKIIGLRYQRNGPRVIWFAEALRGVQQILDSQFKGQVVNIIDFDRTLTRFVVAHYTDRQPVAYDWVDLEKKAAGPINEARPWIDPARMQAIQMFKFKTKDGRKLDAYLTLPAGASAQHPVPLIVIPHGGQAARNVGSAGPFGRDEWGYDAEAQFFASRGYAVLKPNYRGSAGYNWAFPHEDEWDYAKMSEDVATATTTVLRTKLIDKSRIAILGAGFGGYLAAAGAVNDPDLYCCAVAINGIYDWAALLRQMKYTQNENPYHDWLLRRLGEPDQNKARYDAISPGRRAEQIKRPLFVAYDKASSSVEIGQVHDLLSSLDRSHVPHEEMMVNDDRHGMGYLDEQLELRERIEAFLAKNLK